MGSLPKAESRQSISQVVSVMVRSPGLLVMLVYGVKGCHCSTNPTWDRKNRLGKKQQTDTASHKKQVLNIYTKMQNGDVTYILCVRSNTFKLVQLSHTVNTYRQTVKVLQYNKTKTNYNDTQNNLGRALGRAMNVCINKSMHECKVYGKK